LRFKFGILDFLKTAHLFVLTLVSSSCSFKPDLDAVKAQLSPYKTPAITSVSPAQLFTGGQTAVTITGKNLDVGVSVLIGNKPCNIQIYGDGTSLTCTAPAHLEGSYAVEVSTPDGKTAASGVAYDEYALTKLSLVVGQLVFSDDETDGTFNQGACLGSEFLFEHNNLLYAAEFFGTHLRTVNVKTFTSRTILPQNVDTGIIEVATTDPVAPFTPTILEEKLDGFRCLTKDGNTIYFCPNSYSLMSLDLNNPTSPAKLLAGYTYYETDPFADADAYALADPRGYNKLKDQMIVAAFPRGNDMILVLEHVIAKISNFNSTSPNMSVIAGDDVDYDLIDGNNTTARFYGIEKAVLISDDLYLIDGYYSYSYYFIRKLNLADSNLPVSTVLGDIGNLMSLPYNELATDGAGAAAYINNSSSVIVRDGKILIADEFPGTDVFRVRSFDPTTNTISTLVSLKTHNQNQNVVGDITTRGKLSRYAVYGFYYLEQWGMAISTRWGLLRLN